MDKQKKKIVDKEHRKADIKTERCFFDEETFRKCMQYCKTNYYELFPFQKFIYAFAFMYKDDIPIFPKFFINV